MLWHERNPLKNPVLLQNIQQDQKLMFASVTHLFGLKQFCVVDVSILVHEGMGNPEFDHVNIAWRK